MIEVLSLGAGVQSPVVLLMSCRGELPKLDCAIFADTQWEPPAVYKHLGWLATQAAIAGIPLFQVTKGDLRADMLRSMVRAEDYKKETGGRWASMPLYTIVGGKREGQIKRQCTSEYKIEPIEKFIKSKLLNVPKHGRAPFQSVRHWFGISVDELRRARISPARWKVHYYPLIFDLKMNRRDCLDWFERNYPDRPLVKSACVGCPYHSDAEWREIKTDPELWADVVGFDKSIRKCGGMRGKTFLHRSCKPLDEVDFSTAEDRGQLNLFNAECSGMCGV